MAGLITDLAYKTNDYWWNGCYGKRLKRPSGLAHFCGNLVYSLDGKWCKKCKFAKDTDANFKDNVTYNIPNKFSTTITINKDTGQLERNVVNENENKSDDKSEIDTIKSVPDTLFLNDNIMDDLKKSKICNLLCRNFNPSMKDFIKCCVDGGGEYKWNNDNTVKLDNVRLWALYGDYNQNDLLCALLWRTVMSPDDKWPSIIMFEVLFLSTSEHVRYQHYGQEMVKRIMAFCRSNCYDIVSVAAVPRHGISFWSNNGFEMKYDPTNRYKDDGKVKKKGNSDRYIAWENGNNMKKFIQFMKDNMLKFQDTPLFAKFLT